MITQPDRQLPITRDGIPNEVFFNWMLNVTNMAVLSGIGSPEGVVQARSTRFYMDTTGVSGAILYIKRDDDVAGDRSQGWVLV